jgi:hypothetical protein
MLKGVPEALWRGHETISAFRGAPEVSQERLDTKRIENGNLSPSPGTHLGHKIRIFDDLVGHLSYCILILVWKVSGSNLK